MIRNIPSHAKMASRTPITLRTYGYAAALGVALAFVLPVTSAYSQSGYLARDPNVTVNMSALDALGLPATVAGQHVTSDIAITPPVLFPPSTIPVSNLVGPLTKRRFSAAPAPRSQVLAPPVPAAAPLPPAAVAPPPPAVAPPPPVAERTPVPVVLETAKVKVRAAQPAPVVVPTPVPPVPIPPPAPAVVKVAPVPEPAPQEKVAVAVPPPPQPAAKPAALPPTETKPVAEPPVQTASRPDVMTDQPLLRVMFDDKSAKISDSARAPLQELSNKMKESENLRVQLLAYAKGTPETASQARRLSLSRALAVRSFLINQGVRSTRMDVRALGNKAESGPEDWVDAVLVER